MTNNRYDRAKLNTGWIVTDRRSAQLTAMTDQGTWADITNPDQVRFFGLTQDEAKTIVDKLNNG